MKQSEKKALMDAFKPPAPQRKQAFIKKLPQPQVSHLTFVITQAAYIRKWVWALSIIVFAAALVGTLFIDSDLTWIISALIPFVALSAITENARSQIYGMTELEMTSRFSLKSIVLARMTLMGISHLILLCLLIPLTNLHSMAALLQTGIYLLVPYLLTTVLCLWILLRLRGKEATYACMGAAVIVSGLNSILNNTSPLLYKDIYFHKWVGLFIILVLLTILGYYKIICQSEEIKWNLS